MRFSRCSAFLAPLALLLLADEAQATVLVTLSPSSAITLGVGDTVTLSVFAQSDTASGIFGWDVSAHVDDPAVVGLLPDSLDRSGWANHPLTSSDGTAVPNGIDAIYDTEEVDMTRGVGSPVLLFSVDFQALAVGATTLRIVPDDTTGVDFVTWGNELGGDYSQAALAVTVVPEPTSGVLLGLGSLLIASASRPAYLRRKTRFVSSSARPSCSTSPGVLYR